jgi:hypothetical protein
MNSETSIEPTVVAGGLADTGPRQEIEAALAGLDGLDGRPTAQHVPAFERLHGALTEALSAIDGV